MHSRIVIISFDEETDSQKLMELLQIEKNTDTLIFVLQKYFSF